MGHYVYHNLQATEISKLQLIIALYVDYIWRIVFILTSCALSSLRLQGGRKKTDPQFFFGITSVIQHRF